MSAQEQASPGQMRFIGIAVLGAGVYFMLVGSGLLPVPGGRGNLHGPLWIALLIGLVFFLAGVAVLVQSAGRSPTGDLPPDAPFWMRAVQYLIGVTMFAGFAILGSWVAFFGDPRYFSSNVPFLGSIVWFVRAMFGFGALICWLGTIGFAVAGARKLMRRG